MSTTTLEEQWREACAADPRINSPLCRGAFLLGAQAVLEIVRTHSPHPPPDADEILNALGLVNDEVGDWLVKSGVMPAGKPS